MAGLTAAAIGGGAVLGGVASAMQGDPSSTSSVQLSGPLRSEVQAESAGFRSQRELFDFFNNTRGTRPGAAFSQFQEGQRGLASRFDELSRTGARPTAGDIDFGEDVSRNLFQAERVGLNQAFNRQQTDANRLAAQMGRSIDDPILRAKLAQSQTEQEALLNARQGAMSQQLALAQPGQRLGFQQAAVGARGDIFKSELNRLMGAQTLASSVLGQERQFRLATATRTNQQDSGQSGFGNFLSGAVGGAGAGLGIAGGIAGLQNQGKFGTMMDQQIAANQTRSMSVPSMSIPSSVASFDMGSPVPNSPLLSPQDQLNQSSPWKMPAINYDNYNLGRPREPIMTGTDFQRFSGTGFGF